MREASKLQLIAGMIDPSREIAETHRTTLLRLPNERLVWGSTGDINGRVIVLSNADGTRRYLSDAVVSVEQPKWSLMPDNIAAGLTGQDVADLIAFIREASSP
jgi:hypothetical protein